MTLKRLIKYERLFIFYHFIHFISSILYMIKLLLDNNKKICFFSVSRQFTFLRSFFCVFYSWKKNQLWKEKSKYIKWPLLLLFYINTGPLGNFSNFFIFAYTDFFLYPWKCRSVCSHYSQIYFYWFWSGFFLQIFF